MFLWHWVITLGHNSGVFAFFNWVFVNLIFGNTNLSLYLLYNINYSNWVSINSYVFCYPLFEK